MIIVPYFLFFQELIVASFLIYLLSFSFQIIQQILKTHLVSSTVLDKLPDSCVFVTPGTFHPPTLVLIVTP